MEMHEVRYFLAAAQALNFTRAAEECHVAQPRPHPRDPAT
jgi:DNA-binding transcriptional LysR family regulator